MKLLATSMVFTAACAGSLTVTESRPLFGLSYSAPQASEPAAPPAPVATGTTATPAGNASESDVDPDYSTLEKALAEVRSDASRSHACWIDESVAQAKMQLAKVKNEPWRTTGRKRFAETAAMVEAAPWIGSCRAMLKDHEYRRLTQQLAVVEREHQGHLQLRSLPQGETYCQRAPDSKECATEQTMLALQARVQLVEAKYFP